MYDLNIGDEASNTNQSIRIYSDYYNSKWEIKKAVASDTPTKEATEALTCQH